MCESDDGQDDRISRSTGMCESDQAPPNRSRLKPLLQTRLRRVDQQQDRVDSGAIEIGTEMQVRARNAARRADRADRLS